MLADGKDAVECVAVNSSYFSLIFMDNMMPNMNGTQATKLLRESGFSQLIIGLTGNAMDTGTFDL
jgi:CheY-like chemotaxis protein